MRDGSLRCVDVMAAFADRIQRLNPRVNALVQVDLDGAMQAAEAADAARDAGGATGPLFGVPVAIKDGFEVEGFCTTYGAAALRDNVADQDALHVARLKAAGAIVVAKTNMPEFAFGQDTDNVLWGRTRNPYCLNRTAGSSSGGAGAALALDLVPLTDGSDLGGSTRIPASWCNVVGLRPSAGMIPKSPTPAPFDRFHVVGPMARRVDDIRLALSVMAGPDRASPLAPPIPREAFDQPLQGALPGIRIALTLDHGFFQIDPDVARALAPAADVLANAGAEVIAAAPTFDFVARSQDIFRAICAAEYAGWAVDEHGLELGHTILDLVGQSRHMSGYQLERAYALQTKAWRQAVDFFGRYDLACWPTCAGPAFDPSDPDSQHFNWNTLCVSPALNLPSISVPVGFTSDGLPTGLQIIGPPGSDRLILETAEAVERGLQTWENNPPRENPVAVSA